ncbi:ATP:cob(I)alamin adenosyltransferase [Methylocystis sp. SC2]|uniref:ATP:cob(I)alamin adenosyltransferase n=1 Tax=Methylocystis sp. (strain SC2) TaxID=187303 RepID=UPI00027AF046|nr:ATP:cob(I)alamin adenosyltransferase [Methylocystis sp. SC2]CCJ07671.1 Hypothetical protein BN69_2220 [Methylocystis sp. SC2]
MKNLGFDRKFRSFCGGDFTNQRLVDAKARRLDPASGGAETAALEAVARARERARHLNRLSDLLFVLARLADQQSGHARPSDPHHP